MNITELLAHLREVASSPYAFVAYVAVVAAWAYVATAQYRLRTISKIIGNLPEGERAKILLKEYNTLPRSGLTAEQWIRSRRQMLFFLAFLALLVCTTILIVITVSTVPSHRKASLSLVDMLVVDTDEFPKLEIKVRNNSDGVVFLKRAEITTLGQWDLPATGVYPSPVAVSWTYDVMVPVEGTVSCNIAQVIEPSSVDRFEFRMGSDRAIYPFVGLFAYLLRVKLIYNEDNKEVLTPPALLHIPSSMQPAGLAFGEPTLSELERNRELAQEILRTVSKETVFQDGVLDAVMSWTEATFSDYEEW